MTLMNRHNHNFNWNGILDIISIEGCLSFSDRFNGEEPMHPSSIR